MQKNSQSTDYKHAPSEKQSGHLEKSSYSLETLPSGRLIWLRHTISNQEIYEIRVNSGHLGGAAYPFRLTSLGSRSGPIPPQNSVILSYPHQPKVWHQLKKPKKHTGAKVNGCVNSSTFLLLY